MIKLVNCKALFTQDFINDIKKNIHKYHQGFMIVNDELYLPVYTVTRLGLEYDNDIDTFTLADYSEATATDNVSCLFGNHDYINNNEVITLADNVLRVELNKVFELVLDLCHDNYWQGYKDGFEA